MPVALMAALCGLLAVALLGCSPDGQPSKSGDRPTGVAAGEDPPASAAGPTAAPTEPSAAEAGASGEAAQPLLDEDGMSESASATPAPAPSTDPPGGFQAHWLVATRGETIVPREGQPAFVVGPAGGELWTELRDEPKGRSGLLAQLVVGEPVEVDEQRGGWSRISYAGIDGWVRSRHLTVGTEGFAHARVHEELRMVVRAPGIRLQAGGFLPFGCVLPKCERSGGDGVCLALPDGRSVLVDAGDTSSAGAPLEIAEALDRAKGFRGVRFQSGSNTVDAIDAAGLIHLVFRAAGRDLPRSMRLLRVSGDAVDIDRARVGDVVFFSTFYEDQWRPVILLDDGETFIEASPSSGVALGVMEQLRNRNIIEVRRYIDAPANEETGDDSSSRWSWLPWVD